MTGESIELIGRDGTLGALRARAARASRGLGGLILVGGEAGIGKTAVCERLAEQAVLLDGFRSAWAACWQTAVVPPLWPWSQLLRQLHRAEDVLVATDGRIPADPDAARLARFEAVYDQFMRASVAQPLLLVIDDLHWADPASVALLAYLVGPLRSLPTTLIATYRPEDVAGSSLSEAMAHRAAARVPHHARPARR